MAYRGSSKPKLRVERLSRQHASLIQGKSAQRVTWYTQVTAQHKSTNCTLKARLFMFSTHLFNRMHTMYELCKAEPQELQDLFNGHRLCSSGCLAETLWNRKAELVKHFRI